MSTLHPDLQHYRADLRDAIENDLGRQMSRRRSRTRVIRVGVPGFAVALGLSLTLVLGGSQAAFAGWSPSPTGPSAQQTSTAEAGCQAQRALTPPLPGAAPGQGWSVVATDVRGPFTLVVYQDGASDATCLTGPSTTVISQNTAGGRSGSVSGSVSRGGKASGKGGRGVTIGTSSVLSSTSSGSINHVTLTHLESDDQGPFTFVEGQVDEGVTGVTLVLSDGEHVQTTTGNGWFLAWWPGGLDATSAEITSARGTSSQTLSGGRAGQGRIGSPTTVFNGTGNS